MEQALDSLAKDATVVVIAHRLHTVESADIIVVMDGGRIVDTGKHEELRHRQPVYGRLVSTYRR